MPISKYYKGHGSEVMSNMKKEYGEKKGEQVFYATANKRGLKAEGEEEYADCDCKVCKDMRAKGQDALHVRRVVKESHRRVINETGEWDNVEGKPWMDALRANIRQIAAEVPAFRFVAIRGFDMYQGPVATVNYKSKNYKVWMQEADILWIEGFPKDNTSGPGTVAGFQGTVVDIIDMLQEIKESRMAQLTVKLLEAIRAKDWHTANELFEHAMSTRVGAKLSDIKTRVCMEDTKKCELCGGTKDVKTLDDGTTICKDCDIEECAEDLKNGIDKDMTKAPFMKEGELQNDVEQGDQTGGNVGPQDVTEAHQAWKVMLNGKNIDTVFYDKDCDADYVKRGLIDHDGYDPGITVSKDNKYSPKD
jgi:hypothetical protein